MRSFAFWKFRTSEPVGAKKWGYRRIVFGISLGLLAIAAGVATSDWSRLALASVMATGNRFHQTAPAAGLASGGGNFVPVW
jgi:hypothetical protein